MHVRWRLAAQLAPPARQHAAQAGLLESLEDDARERGGIGHHARPESDVDGWRSGVEERREIRRRLVGAGTVGEDEVRQLDVRTPVGGTRDHALGKEVRERHLVVLEQGRAMHQIERRKSERPLAKGVHHVAEPCPHHRADDAVGEEVAHRVMLAGL